MVSKSLEERFRRLLVMVPYVLQRGSVSVEEVCDKFDVRRRELVDDLNLLFMCGLPGYQPDDLIEAFIDGDQVFIRTAEYFSRPLRLTHQEGLLLYAGAQALAAAGESSPALESAIGKIGEAIGKEALGRIRVGVDEPAELMQLKSAVRDGRRVHLVYQSQSKEEVTERDVDPWGVFFSGGRWYLVGWCHLVQDERTFVLDRMKNLTVLSTPAVGPEDFDPTRFQDVDIAGPGSFVATIDLSPRGLWVLDYYPVLSRVLLEDGWTRIAIAFGGTAIATRLMLRLGSDARVEDPPELAVGVQDLARRLLNRYSDGG